jgi:hypothetical protein
VRAGRAPWSRDVAKACAGTALLLCAACASAPVADEPKVRISTFVAAPCDARDPECVCPDGSKPGYVEKVIDLRQPGTPEAGEASLCPGPPLPLQ